jgi:hypothetical protein
MVNTIVILTIQSFVLLYWSTSTRSSGGPDQCTHTLRRLIRLRRYSAKRISAEKRRNSGGPKTSVPKFGMGWSPPVPYDLLQRLGAHGQMPHATCGAMLGAIGASQWAMDTAHTSYFGAL